VEEEAPVSNAECQHCTPCQQQAENLVLSVRASFARCFGGLCCYRLYQALEWLMTTTPLLERVSIRH